MPLLGILAACGGSEPEIIAEPVEFHRPADASDYEDRATKLINRARRSRGLIPLRRDPQLDALARAHARDMAAMRRVTHEGSDGRSGVKRLRRSGYRFSYFAENVSGPDSRYQAIDHRHHRPENTTRRLLESPSHRVNLLNPNLTRLGIAHHHGYWVQVFATPALNPVYSSQSFR
ncbi:MAG: CAP domain-containing protein [Verrucomicrobiales bacterium]